jgi:hypothetical protein
MKKIFFQAAIAAVVGVAGYFGYNSKAPSHEFTDTEMENIEALAYDEVNFGSSDCHFQNGYLAFTGKKGGAYNCCGIWVELRPETSEGLCQ